MNRATQVIFVLLISGLLSIDLLAKEMTVDEVREGILAQRSLIKDVSVSYTVSFVQYLPERQEPDITRYLWTKKGQKESIVNLGSPDEDPALFQITECRYDGKRSWHYTFRGGTRSPKVRVEEGKSMALAQPSPEFLRLGSLSMMPVEEVFARHRLTLEGEEKIQGKRTFRLSSAFGGHLLLKWNLCPEQDLAALRIRQYLHGKIYHDIHSIKLEEIRSSGGRAWFPTKGIWTIYSRDSGEKDQQFTIIIEDLEINRGLEDG